ncbi:MAG: hypothetical protein GY679_03875 [Mycoplasma sp.]|nr:hypothetical protein [Mycoplasma sp.]
MASLAFGKSWLNGGGLNKASDSLFEKGPKLADKPFAFVGATHSNGIVAFVLFVLLISLLLVFRKRLTKLTESNKFWYIYGAICIPFFIFGRYLLFVIQSARAPQGTWTHDMLLQNIFATNLCPLLLIILSSIICFPKLRNKIGKTIAPWTFLSGLLTMFGLALSKSANTFIMFLLFKQSLPWGQSAQFGGHGHEVFDSFQYFSSHAWLILTSTLLLMNVKKYSWKDVAGTMGFIVIYAAYAGIIIGFSHLSSNPIQHDAGGLVPADWQTPKQNKNLNAVWYPGVFQKLNMFKLKGISAVAFGLFGFNLFAFMIALIQYRLINFRGKNTKFKTFFKQIFNKKNKNKNV